MESGVYARARSATPSGFPFSLIDTKLFASDREFLTLQSDVPRFLNLYTAFALEAKN